MFARTNRDRQSSSREKRNPLSVVFLTHWPAPINPRGSTLAPTRAPSRSASFPIRTPPRLNPNLIHQRSCQPAPELSDQILLLDSSISNQSEKSSRLSRSLSCLKARMTLIAKPIYPIYSPNASYVYELSLKHKSEDHGSRVPLRKDVFP